jgi:hypothetical protein
MFQPTRRACCSTATRYSNWIQSHFAGLSAVTHLNLSGNPLDTDPTASIPPAMAASLQVLDMSRLTGNLSALATFSAGDFPASARA